MIQDILFEAKIHPKRKLGELSEIEKDCLFSAMVNTLKNMVDQGGRNTEKNLYGDSGMYVAV